MKTTPLFCSLLAGFLALALAGCGAPSSEPVKAAAQSFMQNVLEGSYPAAYQEGSMNFRTQTRFDDFTFQVGKLKPAPEAKVTWSEPEEKNGAMVIKGTVPRASGEPARVALTLTLEIDQWKVSKFSVE